MISLACNSIIPPADLAFPAQQGYESDSSVRNYNPAIVRAQGRLVMAWRRDSGDWKTDLRRQIGVCSLDGHLCVMPGSIVNLSETIKGGGTLHYDPRFLVFKDRLFIHYNNSFNTRPNRLFLVELDPDTLEAKSPARPIVLDAPRQDIEKNWMFFEHEGDLLAVYQIAPHCIMDVSLDGDGPVRCKPRRAVAWDTSAYAEKFGPPSGGAPPVRCGDEYISFFHSRIPISRLKWVMHYWPVPRGMHLPRYVAAIERRLRRLFDQKRYYAGAYAFAASPPFEPRWVTAEPVLRPEDEPPRKLRRLSTPSADGVVFPCGAIALDDGGWLVSYGLNDESCCIRRIDPTSFTRNGG